MSNYNFKNYRGDTFQSETFYITVNTVDLDLTGASILMQIKKQKNGVSVYEMSTDNSRIVITDAIGGKFKLIKQLLNIPEFGYVYDMQITLGNGDVVTWLKGSFVVTNDTSR